MLQGKPEDIISNDVELVPIVVLSLFLILFLLEKVDFLMENEEI
jgi:hypothetical protein